MTTIIVKVKLNVESDDIDNLIQEMDYSFDSDLENGKIIDTEILDWEEK